MENTNMENINTKPKKGGTGFAVAALVLGIISFLSCGIFGLTELLGAIFGIVGITKSNKKGMSIAGLVLSLLSMLTIIVAIIVFVVVGGASFSALGMLKQVAMNNTLGYTAESPASSNVTSVYDDYYYDDYNYDYDYDYDYDYEENEDSYLWDEPAVEEVIVESEYIIPDSDCRYLTEDDLNGMDAYTLKLARNEIFARHGRKFQDEALQEYFNSKSWYAPIYEAEEFSVNWLNDYEQENAVLIKDMESKLQ